MNRSVVAGLAGVVVLLVGAGAALAAHVENDRVARCEARLGKAAERRGVSVAELEAQIKARMLARVAAALRAGRISAERAGALRDRVSRADLCKPPHVVRIGVVARSLLRPAAAYLELAPAELRAQLPGTSLAALAARRGKSVEGLEAAMLAPAQAKLGRAVETGRITQTRADRALARLELRVDALIQRIFPAG